MAVTRNTLSFGEQISAAAKDFLVNTLLGADYPGENILHNYRVFTYRVTLAIVSNQEFKSQSYKNTGFDHVVFQSHGKVPTGGPASESNSKLLNDLQKFVTALGDTQSKSLDFYLDDLYIKSYMSASKDWATELRMKIVEPYSMDTLMTNIVTGLTAKGYYNFDKNNNFILKIDFVGFPDNSEFPEVIPYSTRYYPLCITSLNASLTQQGTVYEIKAVPMNDTVRFDDVNVVPQPTVAVTGATVKEVLKSYEEKLNKIGQDNKAKSGYEPNKYKIMFVDVTGKNDITETSVIANSKMFDPVNDKGSKEFLKDKKSYVAPMRQQDEALNNANQPKIVLNLNSKDGILNIIDNIITDSYYVVDNIRNEFANGKDADGNLAWWRVQAEPYNDLHDGNRNTHSKEIHIKIYPRTVHYSKVVSMFKPTFVAPADAYEKMCARKYEWLYTGNNKDILSFNLNFNQLWTKIVTGKLGKSTIVPGADKQKNQTTETPDAPAANTQPSDNNTGATANVGAPRTDINPSSDKSKRTNQARSGQETNPLFSLARDINALVNNPYEMVEASIEILGDPMWLGTQFIDNGASVNPNKSNLFTTDGGIAIRTVDPVLRVLAYAPQDFDSNGFLQGDSTGTRDSSKFSAYYTVREVESFFQGGVFKQKLKCNRAILQDMKNVKPSLADRFSMKQINLSI